MTIAKQWKQRLRNAAILTALICASRGAAAQETPMAAAEEPQPPPVPATPPVASPEAVPALRPPPAFAPPPAVVREPRPAWRPRDAHVAISVEQLFTFDAVVVQTNHDTNGDGSYGDFATTDSTFPITGYRGSAPRLAVDALFGGTVGAFFGYRRHTDQSTSHDPVLGTTDSPEHSGTNGLVGLRAGGIIGHGSTVALWLRGGVGYRWSSETPIENGTKSSGFLVALDPVVIVAPLPHLAFTIGPYLEGSRDSQAHFTTGVADPGDHTSFDVVLRFTANVSLMF